MLLGENVLNVESQEIGVVLVQPTILAPTSCSLPDEVPEAGVYHSLLIPARSWRALDFRMATNVPKVT
jgi:hypothetical protein